MFAPRIAATAADPVAPYAAKEPVEATNLPALFAVFSSYVGSCSVGPVDSVRSVGVGSVGVGSVDSKPTIFKFTL